MYNTPDYSLKGINKFLRSGKIYKTILLTTNEPGYSAKSKSPGKQRDGQA
jgi:hypothetical protein